MGSSTKIGVKLSSVTVVYKKNGKVLESGAKSPAPKKTVKNDA